jgi:hypothetical protein
MESGKKKEKKKPKNNKLDQHLRFLNQRVDVLADVRREKKNKSRWKLEEVSARLVVQ